MGGGPGNTISLLDLLDMIEEFHGHRPEIRTGAWRPGDQRYYVSDFSKMNGASGWRPKVSVREGVRQLYDWLRDNTAKPRVRRTVVRAGRDAWAEDSKTRATDDDRRISGSDRKVAM
jgi:CDP-paratose 2-epimerase